MRRIFIVFLFGSLLSLTALAQQPENSKTQPSPSQTESQQSSRSTDDDVVKITTNLVQVDAVVYDKNGKLVTLMKNIGWRHSGSTSR